MEPMRVPEKLLRRDPSRSSVSILLGGLIGVLIGCGYMLFMYASAIPVR